MKTAPGANETGVEFVPYGPEWERELMKFNKRMLIELLRNSMQKNVTFEQQIGALLRKNVRLMDEVIALKAS